MSSRELLEVGVRQCAILVGGFGTRLGALTQGLPKPMVEVGGKPFLAWLLDNLARHQVKEVVLLSGYKAGAFSSMETYASNLGMGLRHSVEPEPAGTGGALLYGADLLDDHFLLLNGDSILDLNYLDLSLPLKTGNLGRLALRPMPDAGRYGLVTLNGDRVEAFQEKQATDTPGLVNGGVYYLSRKILDVLPARSCSLESDVFPKLAAEGKLEGKIYQRPFIDIGIPASLAEAQTFVPAMERRSAVFFDRDGVLNIDIGYAHRQDQLQWVDGAREAVKQVNDLGYLAFVVTNQAGVARGYYTEEDIHIFHRHLQSQLMEIGGHIDDFRHCPHHPTAGFPPLLQACNCRKPGPGMLNSLLGSWSVDKATSFLVGDKPSDLGAAEAAEVPGYLFEGQDLAAFIQGILEQRKAD